MNQAGAKHIEACQHCPLMVPPEFRFTVERGGGRAPPETMRPEIILNQTSHLSNTPDSQCMTLRRNCGFCAAMVAFMPMGTLSGPAS